MVNYICPRCGYETTRKSSMKTHITKVNICPPTFGDINLTEQQSVILKEDNNNKEMCRRIEKLEKDIKTLQTQLAMIANNNNNNNNNTNSNNTNINIQITMAPWNSPDLEGAEHLITSAIKDMCVSVPQAIKKIHFNDDMPQNQNIHFPNARSKEGRVHNGEKWITMKKEEIIDEMFAVYEERLEDFATSKDEENNNNKLTSFIDQYKEYKENDDTVVPRAKEMLNNIIYDNNHKIKSSKNK